MFGPSSKVTLDGSNSSFAPSSTSSRFNKKFPMKASFLGGIMAASLKVIKRWKSTTSRFQAYHRPNVSFTFHFQSVQHRCRFKRRKSKERRLSDVVIVRSVGERVVGRQIITKQLMLVRTIRRRHPDRSVAFANDRSRPNRRGHGTFKAAGLLLHDPGTPCVQVGWTLRV